MSTTWVFLGLLAGREIAIRYRLGKDDASIAPNQLANSIGWALNIALILVVGYVVYLRDQVGDPLILAFAGLIIARAVVVFFESKHQENDLRGTFKMVFMDLSKVSFGLIISIVLVFLMKFLTGGAIG